MDRFKTPPLNVTGYTALQGSNAGRAYNLRCTDSVTSDNTFPCSYYGLAVGVKIAMIAFAQSALAYSVVSKHHLQRNEGHR